MKSINCNHNRNKISNINNINSHKRNKTEFQCVSNPSGVITSKGAETSATIMSKN
jgi:hypothetical protein